MLAHLRDYYTAPGMRGVRARAARTVRDAMADHRIDARRIPEDRDWVHDEGAIDGAEPLAFAIDGRTSWDEAFGPAAARVSYVRPEEPYAADRFERMHHQYQAEERFRRLDRIAQRHHI